MLYQRHLQVKKCVQIGPLKHQIQHCLATNTSPSRISIRQMRKEALSSASSIISIHNISSETDGTQ